MTECNELMCREERSFSSDDTEFMDLPLPPAPVRAVEISNLDVHPSVAACLYNRMEEFDDVPCESSDTCSDDDSPDDCDDNDDDEDDNNSTLNNNSKWSTSDEESSFYRERSSLFHQSECSSPDRKKSNLFLSLISHGVLMSNEYKPKFPLPLQF